MNVFLDKPEQWQILRSGAMGNLCVKTNTPLPGLEAETKAGRLICGVLVIPSLTNQQVKSDKELYAAVARTSPNTVTVAGHGFFDTPAERFIWTGTPGEFCSIWRGD